MPGQSMPAVSVLLPVRDGLPFLEQCVASLRRQTLRELEVVAVDDGSRDGSADLLDAWASQDPRVRVVHQPPGGLILALNAALAAASAPLVARMDADDVCHPRRLELQVRLMEMRPEVGVSSCLVRHFPRHLVQEGFRLYERWLNALVEPDQIARERFVECPVAHPSVVVRRQLLEAAGGYRDVGWPEDYDLWLRLLEAGVSFAKVERPLLFWRDHGQRLSRCGGRYHPKEFLRCKASFLVSGPLAGRRRLLIWGAGRTGRYLARHLEAGTARLQAFVDIDPRKVGRIVRSVPVVAPDSLPGLLLPDTVVVAAVPSRGARDLIRPRLEALGLREGVDFWCAA